MTYRSRPLPENARVLPVALTPPLRVPVRWEGPESATVAEPAGSFISHPATRLDEDVSAEAATMATVTRLGSSMSSPS